VTANPLSLFHRKLIIAFVARHKLPTVYFLCTFVTDGGLISYGPDVPDQFRRAAGFVNRILKGEKPADLPVCRRQPNMSWLSTSRLRRAMPVRLWHSLAR
jgi:putative tryptophan/tyrosine transport system substrate-binding protein